MMIKLTRFVVLCLLSVLMGFSLSYLLLPNFSPYDEKRGMELLIIGGTLIWVLLGGFKKLLFRANSGFCWKMCEWCLIILIVTSSLNAASPRHAFLEVSVFVGLFYLGVLIAIAWQDYQQAWLFSMIGTLSLGAVLYMIGFYTRYLASFLEGIPLVWPEPFFMQSNVRQFNQYQLWTLGLLCLPLLVSGSVKSNLKPWVIGLLSAWWVLFFASGSRGVLLAWILSMLATWWVYRKVARPFLFLQLKTFAFGFLAYELLFIWLPKFNPGGESVVRTILREGISTRIYLWKHAWSMITTHPWLGVGPMHFAWYPNIDAAHPHNSLLQLACEFGLPATVLISMMFGYGAWQWLRRFNSVTLTSASELKRSLVVALFFTVVGSAIYSLVDGVIVMPLSQVMMSVVLGLMLGLYQQDRVSLNLNTMHNLAHRLFAGVVLVIMAWSVLPDLLPRLFGHYEMTPTPYQVIGPRFWHKGGIPQVD